MDPTTTARRLVAAGAELLRTTIQRCSGANFPREITCHLHGHVISITYNGCRERLSARAHVVRIGEESDPHTDYYPGAWMSLKACIDHASHYAPEPEPLPELQPDPKPAAVVLTFPARQAQPQEHSLLSLAIAALEEGEADVATLLRRAYAAGWTTKGKTPAATLNAALHREANKPSPRVRKAGRGAWARA